MHHALRSLVAAATLLAASVTWAATPVFINELHYDNAGADTNEAVELAGPVGTDLSGWSVVLYNGGDGTSYATKALTGSIASNCSGMADGVLVVHPGAIQNGGPDGLALVDASDVVQFLSYEGQFTASNGPAAGLVSQDIGVVESSATAANQSLQLTGNGGDYADLAWGAPSTASLGNCNAGEDLGAAPAPGGAVFINELHYDNAGSDQNEGVEIAGPTGTSVAGWSVVLYNGASGAPYATAALSGAIPATCGGHAGVVVATPGPIQNGAPDGVALIDAGGGVVQFLSYEGSFTATSGPAAGLASSDIGVAENGATAATASLQLTGTGSAPADFTWTGPAPASLGACNAGQSFTGGGGDAPPTVLTTTPADGSAAFAASGHLAVTFSEAVSLSAGWYGISCSDSGNHGATVDGSGATFSLAPTTGFTALETCAFTIHADAVHDIDGTADALANDVVVHFTIGSGDGDDYYAGVDTSSGPALEAWLHQRVTTAPAPYTTIQAYPYTASTTDTWDLLNAADQDPANAGNILDLYHNLSIPKISGGQGGYNREHTWPKSLGFPAESINGKPNPPYTDAHMLHAADSNYNQQRGNGLLGGCTDAAACQPLWTVANDGFGGDESDRGDANWKDGDVLFEVWDHRKGDVARAVMYMAVRYNGGVDAQGICEPDLKLTDTASLVQVMNAQTAPGCSGSANVAYNGLLSALLQWNQQDPPDAQERLRNDVVFSYQHNRNPFIDHPEWAQCVFKNIACPGAGAVASP